MAESYSNIHGDWEKRKISIWGATKAFIFNLKRGQDLTRVPIPAIFFRPYSLLEEIATRVLGRIEQLFGVGNIEDPVERMIGVVSWLISSAKAEDFNHKPYNPVLGEFHKARTDHADGSHSFCLGEQTVHHPPCSAFHLHNPTHGITIEGNWIFDVTFHGNSVTVRTLGGLRVSLRLPSGETETYVLQKGVPDMLIQNVIFGTKYVVWTGDLDIVCPSTQTRADLTFAYKNSANVVKGSISTIDEARSHIDRSTWLYKIKGVCGGKTSLTSVTKKSKEPRLIVDYTNTPFSVPVYPPLDQLEELSSIRLWADVNRAIVENDMATADLHKNRIEEGQRIKVREREANGAEHDALFFHQGEDGFWQVKNLLWFESESDICP